MPAPCPRLLPPQRAFLSCCLLLTCGTAPLFAQWTPNPLSLPSPVYVGAAGTATRTGDLVTAGLGAVSNALEVWSFGGAEWLPLPAPPASARQGAAVAFDRARGELVLFGGVANPLTTPVFFNDTFTLAAGASWQLRAPAGAPSPRQRAGMVYDVRRQRVVLFGGATAAGASNETFEWNGTAWQQRLTATPPPPDGDPALAYDEGREEVVLLAAGGAQYVFDGVNWTQAPVLAPQLVNARLAFDAARGRLVANGTNPTVAVPETWEYDGSQWQFASQSSPQLLGGEALGFDPVQQAVVLHGASGTSAWLPAPAASAAPFGTVCVDPRRALLPAPGSLPALGRTFRMQVGRGGLADLAVGILGTSRTLLGSTPLPTPVPLASPSNCLLRVDVFATWFLATVDPAPWLVVVPNDTALLGVTMQAQVVFVDGLLQVPDTSNGLALRAGLVPVDSEVVETFASTAARDADASGDTWGGGVLAPVGLGGDGRHGSFSPLNGVDQGNNVFLWSTDSQLIPGSQTLDGQQLTVTNGEFFFSDLVIPANVTVRFQGSNPVRLHVRGKVEVRGILDASAPAMTLFNSRNPTPQVTPEIGVAGQPGGLGGPGGARGGAGGNRIRLNPDASGNNGTLDTNGSNGNKGLDLAVPAGHAYAAQAVGTGGFGSPFFPANPGLLTHIPIPGNGLYSAVVGTGGGGGGFSLPGGNAIAVGTVGFTLPATNAQGGIQFNILPLPTPTTSSLAHFLVGGAGGGGGGSHPFAGPTQVTVPQFKRDWYRAGAGGSGGGGAMMMRVGGDLLIATSGTVRANGGPGVLINGDNLNTAINPDQVTTTGNPVTNSWGAPCPGGGGSGGTVLLQAQGSITIDGPISAAGGAASHITSLAFTSLVPPPTTFGDVRGGDGAPGFYRLESNASVVVNSQTNVPAFVAAANSGALLDRDRVSGSRSTWFTPGTAQLPYYRGYVLTADINGQTFVFSDDPALAPPANGAPLRVRFQSAHMRPDGTIDAATIGPWRDSVVGGVEAFGIAHDRGNAFRFDVVVDASAGATVTVRELAVHYR